MTQEQSKDLDTLLNVLNEKTFEVRNINEIHKNVFPNKSYEYCSSLFYILDNWHPRLIKSESSSNGIFFWGQEYINSFLYNGGFTKYFDVEFEKQEAEKVRQKLNDEKLAAEVDIVKFQKGLGKRFTIWAFIVSVIAVLVSILTNAVTDNNNHIQPSPFDTLSLKTQLNNIETRLKNLESKQSKDTTTKSP